MIYTSGSWMVAPVICFALLQPGGSLEQVKRLGLAYLAERDFDRAAGKLEEVWEYDQTDPAVAEKLAVAYLNGQERRTRPELATRAFDLMKTALEARGHATMLVQHSHETLTFIQGENLTKFCAGELIISAGRISYIARYGEKPSEHSFAVETLDLRDVSQVTRSSSGMFHIKLRDKSYVMVPQTKEPQDAEFLLSQILHYCNRKRKN